MVLDRKLEACGYKNEEGINPATTTLKQTIGEGLIPSSFMF